MSIADQSQPGNHDVPAGAAQDDELDLVIEALEPRIALAVPEGGGCASCSPSTDCTAVPGCVPTASTNTSC